MIKNIHVTGVSVSDQDRALDFYTNKLGFEKRADISVGDYRWIEVVPPGAETALVLEPGRGTEGTFTSVVFTTDDMQAVYSSMGFRPQPEFMSRVVGTWLDNDANR